MAAVRSAPLSSGSHLGLGCTSGETCLPMLPPLSPMNLSRLVSSSRPCLFRVLRVTVETPPAPSWPPCGDHEVGAMILLFRPLFPLL
ncbi:hypothetical protein FKM82_007346 [Ascaphus truei]